MASSDEQVLARGNFREAKRCSDRAMLPSLQIVQQDHLSLDFAELSESGLEQPPELCPLKVTRQVCGAGRWSRFQRRPGSDPLVFPEVVRAITNDL